MKKRKVMIVGITTVLALIAFVAFPAFSFAAGPNSEESGKQCCKEYCYENCECNSEGCCQGECTEYCLQQRSQCRNCAGSVDEIVLSSEVIGGPNAEAQGESWSYGEPGSVYCDGSSGDNLMHAWGKK